jgi:hypothetical protein
MGWHEATLHFQKLMKEAKRGPGARKATKKATKKAKKAKKAVKRPRRR